jgi:pimeloyl-ACP methyl ester carboxylesterase
MDDDDAHWRNVQSRRSAKRSEEPVGRSTQMRMPQSVRTSGGSSADIADAWRGSFPYDPGAIRVPTLIVRGEWDSLCADADARWLFDALSKVPLKRDVKIGRATHLMHLEENRHALYREVETFLLGADHPNETL